ncbi:MAG TPA: CRISPR-associated protein Cas4 [Candidatus Atribacteria bacterium]|nr:CRISPR-associated protein Cas4 [Candidatus Atribacteria bacterium]
MAISADSLHLTGVKINYFFVCKRKLWLFDRGIQMEQESDRVLLGKLLDESSYPRRKKRRITINDLIAIDIVDEDSIREVKYSQALEKASMMQIGYYLYYLRSLGIEKKGILSYPKLRKSKEVILTEEMVCELEDAIKEIEKLISQPSPPEAVRKPYCKKCAYFEFCFG